MIIGLTGGMGCGKSTAARMWAELGARWIDSDLIVRQEVLVDPAVVAEVAATWGQTVLDGAGRIDRSQLAERVFGDDAERARLEALVLPRVYAVWRRELAVPGPTLQVVEAPLLFEQQLENWFDFTVCVASSADIQLARLRKRGLSQALAEQRISKQLPLARKAESADVVLWNDGTEELLREQVVHLHARFTTERGAA